jgi:hypothetical protein
MTQSNNAMTERNKDSHGLKIQGRGKLKFLPKSLVGVKAFRKNFQGGSPILNFIVFFIKKYFEIRLGGPIFTLPPLCASMQRNDLVSN